MDTPLDERPAVRCFAMLPSIDDPRRVAVIMYVHLETAALLKEAGWIIIGPDPADLEALATWEREHRDPLRG